MSNTQTGQPDTDSVGGLVSDMSAQVSRLVRAELQLAQADLQQKGKKAGAGAGLFGGAAVLGLYALGCFITAAILALALVIAGWLAALLVGVVLVVVAAIAALVGRRQVKEAVPPVPTEAVAGLKKDAQALRGHDGSNQQ